MASHFHAENVSKLSSLCMQVVHREGESESEGD